MRALHLLGNCVNVTSSANRNGEFTIAPSQTVPALFELNFYSNGLFHVFISDAIIGTISCKIIFIFCARSNVLLPRCKTVFCCCSPACSILSLQRELIAESESDQQSGDPSSLPLSQERLIRKAAGLSYFLINEVAVAPVSPANSQLSKLICENGGSTKNIFKLSTFVLICSALREICTVFIKVA